MKIINYVLWLVLSVLPAMSYAGEADNKEKSFTIAWALQPVSMDPQYKSSLRANNILQNHMFEPLFTTSSSGEVTPVLVQEYKVEDHLNWLLKLKKNVYFHDGQEMTAEDVMATFRRLDTRSPDNAFRKFFAGNMKLTKLGRYKFRITTTNPEPDLLGRLVLYKIISHKYEKATEDDFNSGKAIVGTGPYRWGGKVKMKYFHFIAFDRYHGEIPHLKRADAVVVTDRQQRLRGFQDGKFDLVDSLLPSDMSALQESSNARFSMPNGEKLYHIRLDHQRNVSPFVTDNNGRPMKKNPLKDKRVRQAMSLAIDRQLLVDKFLGSRGGSPAGQLVNRGFKGYMPGLLPDIQNFEKAKALLAAAGYPDGFQITIHDKQARKPILELIASMLSKVGIKAKVDALPPAEYFPRNANHEFSVGLLWSSSSGSIRGLLNDLIRTGGGVNSGRYSNSEVDSVIEEALSTFDPDERYRLYSYAMELAMEDYAIIPLHFLNDIWAIRSDMAFIPATLGGTLAQYVKPNELSFSRRRDYSGYTLMSRLPEASN